ncbi:uncharacterized protein LOC115478516 isoform X2 [Microcaecilia unicolor]|uniref:Uncharacterized protein LOC115478516 isoform X2 n=1 Tax=Microcaecilia unicolor TaxID=1415580 RepID=A0A6P7Z565_9AMPH|nr:uncharacterized protein LOC115478516 isoform X2 [Microcaecilia unicolor]
MPSQRAKKQGAALKVSKSAAALKKKNVAPEQSGRKGAATGRKGAAARTAPPRRSRTRAAQQPEASHGRSSTDLDALMAELRKQIEQHGVSTVTQQLQAVGAQPAADPETEASGLSQLQGTRRSQQRPVQSMPQAPLFEHAPLTSSVATL